MDVCQQRLYCSKTYSYIGADITHLCGNHSESIIYISAKQLPDDGFMIEHDRLQLPFLHESHCDSFLHPSDDGSSNTEANTNDAYIDPQQPPVWTCIYGTPHKDNHLASRLLRNEYFDNLSDEDNLWSPFSCEEEY